MKAFFCVGFVAGTGTQVADKDLCTVGSGSDQTFDFISFQTCVFLGDAVCTDSGVGWFRIRV